jgi:RNA polymerase sigma-70 factor (ECF subfamily)
MLKKLWLILSGQSFEGELENMQWNNKGTGQANAIGMEYMDGLYGYALYLTRNYAEAEDLVQETYVRAMSAMARLREGSNVKVWLFTILRNIWFNQLRCRRNRPQMVGVENEDGDANRVVEPSKGPHDTYVSKVEAEHVRAAIQELQTEYREIILLREYEELSYQEIASVLKCPVGTVMSRLSRARAKLHPLLSARLFSPRARVTPLTPPLQ